MRDLLLKVSRNISKTINIYTHTQDFSHFGTLFYILSFVIFITKLVGVSVSLIVNSLALHYTSHSSRPTDRSTRPCSHSKLLLPYFFLYDLFLTFINSIS